MPIAFAQNGAVRDRALPLLRQMPKHQPPVEHHHLSEGASARPSLRLTVLRAPWPAAAAPADGNRRGAVCRARPPARPHVVVIQLTVLFRRSPPAPAASLLGAAYAARWVCKPPAADPGSSSSMLWAPRSPPAACRSAYRHAPPAGSDAQRAVAPRRLAVRPTPVRTNLSIDGWRLRSCGLEHDPLVTLRHVIPQAKAAAARRPSRRNVVPPAL